MENKYMITAEGVVVSANELRHWGIKGMKWGLRRYQNPDGSLTEAGRKRYMNSDGTLNDKGKKYYAEESARLKAEKARLKAEKESNARFDKLERMRKSNADLEAHNKKKADDVAEVDTPKSKTTSDMTDKELQDKVNRLRNEDAYRDLNKKLGYNDGPKTELDAKIAEMEKQKKYLELQRDINNLTPKQENKMKKLMDKLVDDVLIPSAVEAGKKTLTSYLTEAGAQAVGKTAKNYTDKITKTVTDSKKRVDEKAAKEKAKEEAKAAKKAAKEEAKAAKKAAKEEAKAAKAEVKAEKKREQEETRLEAKAEREKRRAEERAAWREDTDEASARIVNFVADTAHKMKNTDSIYGTKAYEKKVDQMLRDMDDESWEMYNRMYRRDDD